LLLAINLSCQDQNLINTLKSGKEKWNIWRLENMFKELQNWSSHVRDVNLCGANLAGAHLDSFDLMNVNLRRANLSGASLKGADLSFANLNLANLSEADLSRADLQGATLIGANLAGAHLWGANLEGVIGANLQEAFIDANFREAEPGGADFHEPHIEEKEPNFVDPTLREPYDKEEQEK
jgi:uncharacterized protein YjbI with pentapeptide repeats